MMMMMMLWTDFFIKVITQKIYKLHEERTTCIWMSFLVDDWCLKPNPPYKTKKFKVN